MRGRDPLALVLVALLLYAALVLASARILIEGTPQAAASALDERARAAAVAVRPAVGERELVVPAGAGGAGIAQLAADAGVLRDQRAFLLLLDYQRAAPELQAGRYLLARPTPAGELIRRLRAGVPTELVICVPAGLRLEELRALLVERDDEAPGGCAAGPVVSAASWDAAHEGPRSHPLLAARPEGASLQGYLAAQGYALEQAGSAESLVQAMLDALAEVVTPELRRGAEARGLSLHELLTLASIVQREGALEEEYGLIASVFLNRLAQGIPLQADPTVQYAIATEESARRDGWWKEGLTVDDLAVDSPYNTYRIGGLPPGPIAQPGSAAIRAVVGAPETELLYFVANPSCDGVSHLFAETLDEHIANVGRYRDACE
ncbi:MAG: endolytic transglycosylase MltG [Chloroflexi bacterium]|nr:endolytic transglycosylase MltG [Chloroflexota bacterium]